ncbi:MAG: tripartite tricarboxylate transporter substrate binding protein [Burkholderiales bacterium]|nr:tripartite tricarboxylate transporter substrate binding protein [Burkholderiales bacterium]
MYSCSYRRRMCVRFATFAVALLAGIDPAPAQVYPERPVRLVLPFPPGGGTDSMARLIAPKLGQALGQPIVIDNRPGAAGVLAAEIVARSAPDGYTLFMGSSTGVTAAPSLYKLPYDTARDFAPITQFATASFMLAVHPSVAAASVGELVALARAKPRSLNYASGGIGSPLHLAAELFKHRAGVDIVHVAYKGGVPAATAVLAGEAQMIFGSFAASLAHVRAGRLRALAGTGLERSALMPELPTMIESGFPGFHVQAWSSFEAPARTPPAIVRRLYEETAKVVRMPDVVALMSKIGYLPADTTPQQYAHIRRTEMALWAKLIKDANIRGE